MDSVEGVHPSRLNLIRSPPQPEARGKGKKKQRTTREKDDGRIKKKPNKSKGRKNHAKKEERQDAPAPPPPPPPPPPPALARTHLTKEQLPERIVAAPSMAFKTGFSYISITGKIHGVTTADYTALSSLLSKKYKPTLQSVATLELILSRPAILHFLKFHPPLDREMVRCQQFMEMVTTAVVNEGVTAKMMAGSKAVLERWASLLERMEAEMQSRREMFGNGKQAGAFVKALDEARGIAAETRKFLVFSS